MTALSEREPSAATDPAGSDRRGVLVGTGAPSRSESAATVQTCARGVFPTWAAFFDIERALDAAAWWFWITTPRILRASA